MYYNFINFVKKINNIFSYTHQEAVNELDTTQILLFSAFFLQEAFSFVAVMMGIAFYIMI